MPELPEVEYGRRVAAAALVGRRIASAHCADDRIVVEGVAPGDVELALLGRRVLEVDRRGKYLWLELDARPWPVVHFGMTGAFRTPGGEKLQLASDGNRPPDDDWPPRFTKLLLTLDDGSEFAFVNKRRLGRIRLRRDPVAEPPIAELGFDPLLDLPSAGEFAQLLAGRRGNLKGLLLNQRFAAGVGNWIADEVLYQARLDPHRSVDSLAPVEIERLRKKLDHVIRRTVAVDAEKSRLPRTWLFHRRWGKKADAKTVRGEPIEHVQVAGRTTAWVPSRQK